MTVTVTRSRQGVPEGANRRLTHFDRILVPLPRAALDDRSLPVAVGLAQRSGVPVRLLTVAVPGDQRAVAAALTELANRCGDVEAVEVDTLVVPYGSIADAIVRAAPPRTLICMGSREVGRPARSLLGTVTEQVLGLATEPVLLVGPHVRPHDFSHGAIVACLGGSLSSGRTLMPARCWSDALGLPLRLVRVVSAEPAPTGPWELVHDRDPARALAALAEQSPVAVLVMATRDRTGWNRLLSGSVTAATVHRAPVPVLVVPTHP